MGGSTCSADFAIGSPTMSLCSESALTEDHEQIIEAIGWMCPHTAEWTAHHSRVVAVLAAP